jgi:pimeloyl-ACP methyl ester carboxylesterase
VNQLDQAAAVPVFGHQAAALRRADGVASAPPVASHRQVYVLHSGMNDPDNTAAISLRQGLLARGVRPEDIIVMPARFPGFGASVTGMQENWNRYRAATDPNSTFCQQTYQDLQQELLRRNIRPTDSLTWIGHSAGGQVGLSVCNTAQQSGPFRFRQVITLGTPTAANPAPPEVQVRQYISPSDGVLVATNQMGMDGVTAEAYASRLDSNDRVRVFNSVTHGQWHSDPAVLDRIIAETQPERLPPPRTWWGRIMDSVSWFLETTFGFSWERSRTA